MTASEVALATGLLGAVLGLLIGVPQAYRVWTGRSAVGVSLLMWLLMTLLFSSWLGFGWRTASWPIAGMNVINLLTASAVIAGTLRADGWPAGPTWRSALVVPVLVILGVTFGGLAPIGLVVTLLIAGALTRVPQISASWHTLRHARASQVSRATWWLTLASNSCWLTYGVAAGIPAVQVTSIIGMAIAVVVLAMEYLAASRRMSA